MKPIQVFLPMWLAILIFGTPMTRGDEGAEILSGLNSPNYTERELATFALEQYSQKKFFEAAKREFADKEAPENWHLLRAQLVQAADSLWLGELRDAAGRMGAEVALRFSVVEARWPESARRAALAAGLDAPGDFEADLIKSSQEHANLQLRQLPIAALAR